MYLANPDDGAGHRTAGFFSAPCVTAPCPGGSCAWSSSSSSSSSSNDLIDGRYRCRCFKARSLASHFPTPNSLITLFLFVVGGSVMNQS